MQAKQKWIVKVFIGMGSEERESISSIPNLTSPIDVKNRPSVFSIPYNLHFTPDKFLRAKLLRCKNIILESK